MILFEKTLKNPKYILKEGDNFDNHLDATLQLSRYASLLNLFLEGVCLISLLVNNLILTYFDPRTIGMK